MAVIHLFGPFSLIYKYYRVSIADYIAFNVAFVRRQFPFLVSFEIHGMKPHWEDIAY